jgi:DNA-binding transcriptional LysR family regulator
MRFDLTDLRLFLHITEAGSITAGAGRSHLALASASARIRGMEEQLGVPLLSRVRHGVEPTPAGLTLSHHARLVLAQMEQMRGELGAYAHGLRGHVRVLCNTAALTEFLPEALGRFMADNPHVNIDLEERLSYDIVQAVVDGQADIGIVTDSVDMAGLEQYPFRPDRLVVVAARDHPLLAGAGGKKPAALRFEQVLDYDFIGLAGDSALQRYLGEHAARAGKALSYRIRLRSFDAICRVVESGAGIAVVPATAALACQRAMRIRSVRLSDAWAERNLTLCVRRLSDLPAHASRLVMALRSDVAQTSAAAQ